MSSLADRASGRAQEWQPSVNPWLIAAAVMSATFMVVLDTSVANVALPHIAGNLSASRDESTWVLTSYLVANAIVIPATGWISSFFGRKRFLIISIVVFTLASFLCGAATSMSMLIFARILQGAGGGGMQPIAQAVLLESFPQEKRGAAMAVYGLGVVVAPIIGPALGGWITDNYSWRWVFYINLPVGILAVLMSQAFLEDPPYIKKAAPGRIDYIGFGLLVLWLGALQLALDQGQQEDWFASRWIVFLSIIAVVGLITFIVWELKSKEPIVNLRILTNGSFAVGTALMTIMGGVLYGSLALLPLFLQTMMGYPALQSGIAVSPRGVGSFISMPIAGRLVGIIDDKVLIAIGFAVLGYSSWMLGDINLDIAMSNVTWPNVVSGFAMSFIFVPMMTAAMGTLKQEEMGNATGIFNLMRNIGGSVGIALVSTLLSRGAQAHQAVMVSHLTPYDPAFQERLHQLQGPLGQQGAYAAIYGILVKQATLMAFVDNFRLLAVTCFVCIPLVLLFKGAKARLSAGVVDMH